MLAGPLPIGTASNDRPKQTALVVEDDPRVRLEMSEALVGLDFDVLAATHFDEAVGHLQARVVHIVCIDIGLPDKSGYELCEHIRGPMGLAGMPILATSDYGTAVDVTQAERAGANGFLLKPFATGRFTDLVHRLLDGPAGRASRPRG